MLLFRVDLISPLNYGEWSPGIITIVHYQRYLSSHFEFHNFMMQTVDEIYKVASVSLSPNVPAQIFVS